MHSLKYWKQNLDTISKVLWWDVNTNVLIFFTDESKVEWKKIIKHKDTSSILTNVSILHPIKTWEHWPERCWMAGCLKKEVTSSELILFRASDGQHKFKIQIKNSTNVNTSSQGHDEVYKVDFCVLKSTWARNTDW